MKTALIFLIFFGSYHLDLTKVETHTSWESCLDKEWKKQDGWFTENAISFKTPVAKDTASMRDIFIFHKGGSFTHELKLPAGIGGICGNGLLYLNESTWNMQDNILTIHMKGGHLVEDEFDYIVKYTITKMSKDELVLTKLK